MNNSNIAFKKRRRAKYLVIAVVLIVCTVVLFDWGTRFLIGQHQRSVMTLLRDWREQYSSIHSVEDAVRAIKMYDYIKKYYAVGDGKGYYSFRRIMLELENQRAETLDAIVEALGQFTGLQYGHDYEKWEEWMEEVRNSDFNDALPKN